MFMLTGVILCRAAHFKTTRRGLDPATVSPVPLDSYTTVFHCHRSNANAWLAILRRNNASGDKGRDHGRFGRIT